MWIIVFLYVCEWRFFWVALCNRAANDSALLTEDIQVRFYEEKDGMIEWEGYGDFQASDVHKQVAISFKTPRYKSLEVRECGLLSA